MAMAATVALAGCGSDSGATADAPPKTPDAAAGFPQPSGTIAVSFSVDDTANKAYAAVKADGASDLQWKGSMTYDPITRKATYDSAWGGPWAPLYDDGPWTAGGHEPAGATKGDNKWGITVFITPPATGKQDYGYGLNDDAYQTKYGNGWIWFGTDGGFTATGGSTAAVTATGLTLPKWGTTDIQLTIDTAALDPAFQVADKAKVGVKGSGWAWGVVDLTSKLSGGKATFTLSENVGTGKTFNHSGLLSSGDKPEWVFVIGADGKEYFDANKKGYTAGVTAAVKASGASAFTPATILNKTTGDPNAYIAIP